MNRWRTCCIRPSAGRDERCGPDLSLAPDVCQSFANQGALLTPGDADQLAQLIKSELARFGRVIRESEIRRN